MLLVEVQDVVVTNIGIAVLLNTPQDSRSLPIFIGPAEAQSITLKLNDLSFARPLTHDLIAEILSTLNVSLDCVRITDVRDGTFFAELILRTQDEESIRIDCRPSDAIALALRTDSPIFVEEAVFASAAQQMPDDSDTMKPNAPHPSDPLKALKRQLEQAISDERYEDAAKLRDRIAAFPSEA